MLSLSLKFVSLLNSVQNKFFACQCLLNSLFFLRSIRRLSSNELIGYLFAFVHLGIFSIGFLRHALRGKVNNSVRVFTGKQVLKTTWHQSPQVLNFWKVNSVPQAQWLFLPCLSFYWLLGNTANHSNSTSNMGGLRFYVKCGAENESL